MLLASTGISSVLREASRELQLRGVCLRAYTETSMAGPSGATIQGQVLQEESKACDFLHTRRYEGSCGGAGVSERDRSQMGTVSGRHPCGGEGLIDGWLAGGRWVT